MAKKSKQVLAAELVILEAKLAEARERATRGRMWQGMPRPEWARKQLEHWKQRVVEEDEAAKKSKAAAAKRVAELEAQIAETKKAQQG